MFAGAEGGEAFAGEKGLFWGRQSWRLGLIGLIEEWKRLVCWLEGMEVGSGWVSREGRVVGCVVVRFANWKLVE